MLSDFEKQKLCLWGRLHPSYIPYCWNHVITATKRISPAMPNLILESIYAFCKPIIATLHLNI